MNGPKAMSALSPLDSQLRTLVGAARRSHACRYCCKSLFTLVIKNSPGCRRDFRVKMWGTSSPDDKLTGDLGNVIETTQIAGRRLVRLMARNLSPGNFGLLQHNLPISDLMRRSKTASYSITSSPSASSVGGVSRPSVFAVLRLTTSSYLVGACPCVHRGKSLPPRGTPRFSRL
jgi:hypothetical protein